MLRFLRGLSAFGINQFCCQPFQEAQFDIFEWYPKFQSCARYFLDVAQYSVPVQAVAAFVNIQLPCQKVQNSIPPSKPAGRVSPPTSAAPSRAASNMAMATQPPPPAYVTLVPYVRRLVATGFDFPAVLHGFFGDDWAAGVGPMHETERRNYLFAAKSDNWSTVKATYDMGNDETIPFLRPLQNVTEKEILSAEVHWSEWLAMQDWMLGPRAPPEVGRARVPIKSED
jgi:hypothetical protein